MFERATSKLDDARTIIGNMKTARDAQAFRSAFNSFLSAARAVTYALQKEGKPLEGFSDWYNRKQEEMKGDELLRFIHQARTQDFHEGKHRLHFGTHIQHLSIGAEPPPSKNAAFVIGADGPFWIVDEGTSRERKIPFKAASYTVRVTCDCPPSMHLGKKLDTDDPVTICELATAYFENLVYEAKTKFGKQ